MGMTEEAVPFLKNSYALFAGFERYRELANFENYVKRHFNFTMNMDINVIVGRRPPKRVCCVFFNN
jgi:hypothetical protein